MRKLDGELATKATMAAAVRDHASLQLVCLALLLAVSALLWRIASIW
jgi:hypothetical protein